MPIQKIIQPCDSYWGFINEVLLVWAHLLVVKPINLLQRQIPNSVQEESNLDDLNHALLFIPSPVFINKYSSAMLDTTTYKYIPQRTYCRSNYFNYGCLISLFSNLLINIKVMDFIKNHGLVFHWYSLERAPP